MTLERDRARTAGHFFSGVHSNGQPSVGINTYISYEATIVPTTLEMSQRSIDSENAFQTGYVLCYRHFKNWVRMTFTCAYQIEINFSCMILNPQGVELFSRVSAAAV